MLKKPKDIIFYLVIIYVLIAGGWWSYLLYIKNQDALNSKKELLWLSMKNNGVAEYKIYEESAELTKLATEYDRQNKMILGEGLVLLLLTILGITKIAKSRQREIELANQQRNFLLSITHELKSPLAAIKLILQTFQKRKLTENQSKILTQNGLTDVERLHDLVNDLLLSARIDGGGYQFIFEPLDLIELLTECIAYSQPKYNGEIKWRANVNHILLQKADKNALTSVFINLIGNAIKYAPNSEKIEINLDIKKEMAIVEVVDYGVGIAKEEKEKIYQKFYRIGNEDTRQTKGTGLGLYIAYKIIVNHKGKIYTKNNLPQGTIFQVELPLN